MKKKMVVNKRSVGENCENNNDILCRCIGEFGLWQFIFACLATGASIVGAFNMFTSNFQMIVGNYWCAPPAQWEHLSKEEWLNISQVFSDTEEGNTANPCLIKDKNYENALLSQLISDSTQKSRKCSKWQYDKELYGETIVTQWNLVCEDEIFGNVAEMAFLVGIAFGGPTSGILSDWFGRKRSIAYTLIIQNLLAICTAYSPSYWVFVVLRGISGVCCVGIVGNGFVLAIELVSGKWGTIVGVAYWLGNSIAMMIMGGVAYLIRDWRKLQLATSVPGILFLFSIWILPESPRWLLLQRKDEEFIKIMKEAAKMNGRILPTNLPDLIKEVSSKKSDSAEPPAKVTLLDLVKTKELRKLCSVLLVTWFSVNMLYYGLSLNISKIGGDVYVNSVISGGVEIPSLLFSIFILLKTGRRWTLVCSSLLAGISCFISIAIPKHEEYEWISVTFTMIGKFCITLSSSVITMFTAEQYPTEMRNLGTNFMNVVVGAALILIPYLWNTSAIFPDMPMVVLGVLGVLGGVIILFLKEHNHLLNGS